MSARRVLVTLPDVAWPLHGGKRLRCYGVLAALAATSTVDVAFLHADATPGTSPVPPGVTVRDWVRLSPAPRGRLAGACASLARGLPVHVAAQRWDVVRRRLRPFAEREYDLVWFGGLDHAQALHGTVAGHRVVVDCDDVETEKWRAYLAAGAGGRVERAQRRVELPLWSRIQHGVARWADAVVVCSDLDVDRFGSAGGSAGAGTRVAVVPNTYPVPPSAPDLPRARPDGPPRVLMVASWANRQNRDAAEHAVREVLPQVRTLLPTARLRVVGRGTDALGEVSAVDGVDVVGPVDDVAGELTAATAVLVPMRFGGGTRLKVLEAWAHGVPVVSTGLGCEGTGAVDDDHLLVRDGARELAAGVHEVVTDHALADRLAAGGRRRYLEAFTPDAAVRAVGDLLDRLDHPS